MFFHFALLAVSCRLTHGVCIAASATPINGANRRRLLPKLSPRCFEFPLPSRSCLPQTRAAHSFGGTTSHVCRVVAREAPSMPRRHCRIVVPSDASALLHSPNMRRSIPATRKQNSLLRQASMGQTTCASVGLQWLFRVVEVVRGTSAVLQHFHSCYRTPHAAQRTSEAHIFIFFVCVWERDTFRRA